MRVGIVGSRRRNSLVDRQQILDLVRDLKVKFDDELVLVSGGCKSGADHYAEEAAKIYNVKITLHLPSGKTRSKWEFRQAAYTRNKLIAEDSDVLFAQVASDRTGGTENTLEHAKNAHVLCWLVNLDGAIIAPSEWPSIPI